MIGRNAPNSVAAALLKGVSDVIEHGKVFTADSVANARETIEWPGVYITEYQKPWNCFLRSKQRRANPFFHYLEAMWILAGRRDVRFLAHLVPRMAEYSDNGETFHGAYGYRLRRAYGGIDQIEVAIRTLAEKPASRQVVMSIWHPVYDLGTVSKDIPCNDMVMLKVRDHKLNMTVCNRSNDAVWGAYGANAVQFSMLLMYMAARLGLSIGRYTQVSDSMHGYTDNAYFDRIRNEYAEHEHPMDVEGTASCELALESAHGLSVVEFNPFTFVDDNQIARFFEAFDNDAEPEYRIGDCIAVRDAVAVLAMYRAHKTKAQYSGPDIINPALALACAAWLEG